MKSWEQLTVEVGALPRKRHMMLLQSHDFAIYYDSQGVNNLNLPDLYELYHSLQPLLSTNKNYTVWSRAGNVLSSLAIGEGLPQCSAKHLPQRADCSVQGLNGCW